MHHATYPIAHTKHIPAPQMHTMSKSLRTFLVHQPKALQGRASTAWLADKPSSSLNPGWWSAWQYIASFWLAPSRQSNPPATIYTAYGLTLTKSYQRGSYECELSTVEATQTGEGTDVQKHHYRIFPDLGTSFFWKNPKFPVGPPGSSNIDDEDIESRYPSLAPYFFAWRALYEDAFYEQEIHLGSKAEVIPDVAVRVAWLIEGFLMACWLALQRDVGSTEFLPGDKAYTVEKATVNKELNKFLESMDALLEETQ